jgi:hypothetical protein
MRSGSEDFAESAPSNRLRGNWTVCEVLSKVPSWSDTRMHGSISSALTERRNLCGPPMMRRGSFRTVKALRS